MTPHSYAELQTTTNFDFLRGASQPWELVLGAKALGLEAIGIADRNTLAGVVRAWSQGKAIGQRVLTGSRLVFADGTPEVVVYPTDRDAWGRLTRLLTLGQRRAKKGECHLFAHDLTGHAEGLLLLVVPPAKPTSAFETCLRELAGDHPDQVWLLASRPYGAQDLKRLAKLDALARRCGAPMVASNAVLYHGPERRPLQDVLTCVREGCSIGDRRPAPGGQRRAPPQGRADEMTFACSSRLARSGGAHGGDRRTRSTFDLGQLKYEYPRMSPCRPARRPIAHLTDLAWAGAEVALSGTGVHGQGAKPGIASELALIEELELPATTSSPCTTSSAGRESEGHTVSGARDRRPIRWCVSASG